MSNFTSFEVSVVIPSFNRAQLLPATLDSVLAQTHPAKEVIVVDDGSTDDTESVIRSRYPSVQYRRIANAGAPHARNIGAQMSTAPWVAFLDSDDLWCPKNLERHTALHAMAPEVEYSFSNFRIVADDKWHQRTKFDDAPADFFDGASELAPGFRVAAPDMYQRLLRFQPIFPSCFVISRRALIDVGEWDASLGRVLSEDLEFTLRCALHLRMGIIDDSPVGIRKHSGNFSADKFRVLMGEITILKYVESHHTLSPDTRADVRRQISLRTRDAVDLAFEVANFPLVRELIRGASGRDRRMRQAIKGMIASLPSPVARAIRRTVSR